MDFIVSYELSATILLTIILFSYYWRNNFPFEHNRIFLYMVWFSLICSSVNLTGALLDGSAWIHANCLLYACNYIYFLIRQTLPLLYVRYVGALIHSESGKRLRLPFYFYLPLCLSQLLVLLNPVRRGIFYFDEANHYRRGPLMPVLYLVACFYVVYGAYFLYRNRKNVPVYKRGALNAFAILMSAPFLTQFFFPNILLESFGISICLLLIFLTIQRPEELLDGQTGLLNRTAFTNIVRSGYSKGNTFFVISVYLDDIHFLRNTFGVSCVEALRRDTARLISQESPWQAFGVADEQFCLLMDQSDFAEADKKMRTLAAYFDNDWTYEDMRIKVYARFCLIECPCDARTLEDILYLIDVGAAQAHKRNATVLYARDLGYHNQDRYAAIDRFLQGAVETGAFDVFYQPIYNTALGRITSAEALVRLKENKTVGFVSPDEFIPIAERNGTILRLGAFVFAQVCRAITRDNAFAEIGLQYIEVNLSVVQAIQEELVDQIVCLMDNFGVRADQINLEITETATSANGDMLKRNMSLLSEMGVSFSLDDYGTGYSNMRYLLELPLRIVKLDKSVVWAAFESESGEIALTSTVSMLKKLGYEIVAEGIETKEQKEMMIEIGCDYLQGYYFSKPLALEPFLDYARTYNRDAVPLAAQNPYE